MSNDHKLACSDWIAVFYEQLDAVPAVICLHAPLPPSMTRTPTERRLRIKAGVAQPEEPVEFWLLDSRRDVKLAIYLTDEALEQFEARKAAIASGALMDGASEVGAELGSTLDQVRKLPEIGEV